MKPKYNVGDIVLDRHQHALKIIDIQKTNGRIKYFLNFAEPIEADGESLFKTRDDVIRFNNMEFLLERNYETKRTIKYYKKQKNKNQSMLKKNKEKLRCMKIELKNRKRQNLAIYGISKNIDKLEQTIQQRIRKISAINRIFKDCDAEQKEINDSIKELEKEYLILYLAGVN